MVPRAGATPTWASTSIVMEKWTLSSFVAVSSMHSAGSPKCRLQRRPSEPC